MKVIYVSYDGALDPLGASQVVPYLIGLAAHFTITLITFEKPKRWIQANGRLAMQRRLGAAGIRWKPLRYHRRPRLVGTVLDMIVGSRSIAREAARCSPAIVHCRGDVAAAMARWALPSTIRFLYDVRGFFSDERVETGSWRRGSFVDRAVRRIEAANLKRADGAVVLTHHAAEALRRLRPSLLSLRVIPTCVDVSVFRPRAPGQKPEFGLAYNGSLGTWYMADEMVAFARSARGTVLEPTLFLTPEPEEVKRRLGATPDWAEIRTVEPEGVAEWLRRASAIFFFIRPIPSKRASCPTKFAEALASGLPVVCNRGIGDLDDIVEREGIGVLVDGFSGAAYSVAVRRLKGLLEDPGLSERCRRLAETRYSVDRGVEAYHGLYTELVTGANPFARGPGRTS